MVTARNSKYMAKLQTGLDQFISDPTEILITLRRAVGWQTPTAAQRTRIVTRHTGSSVQLFLLRNMWPSAISSSSDATRSYF